MGSLINMQQRFVFIGILLVLLGFTACKRKKTSKTSTLTPLYAIDFSPKLAQTDTHYYYTGYMKLENAWLNEASGLCASRSIAGMLWSHNDSGDPARIFALGLKGEDYATCYMEGAKHKDYEDICMGKYKRANKASIFVADIGDNLNSRSHINIYEFEEPTVDTSLRNATLTIAPEMIRKYQLEFPDGARDAEGIMFDPIEEAIYIVSKREKKIGVYKVLVQTETLASLSLVAQLPLTWVVAADISSDGKKIVIKTGDEIWYWERKGSEPLGVVLQQLPRKLPCKKEKQGEAFAWSIKGDAYYTLGESSIFSASILNCYASYP